MGKLDELDMSLSLPKKEAKKRLKEEQRRLLALRLRLGGLIGDGELGPPVCVVFEGWDASGKGGAVKRLVRKLDPRHVRVRAFSAPTEDELRHHWLWRFWPELPGWGGMTVFDRSWYGRVLVERIEGFCTQADWMRAYGEINDFEEQLSQAGVVVVKFWLSIDEQTQLQRFKEREAIPFKRFKITEDDWRNREKWGLYRDAVGDMVDRTSTEIAPWTLVEANDKRWARVKVLRTLGDALQAAFKRDKD